MDTIRELLEAAEDVVAEADLEDGNRYGYMIGVSALDALRAAVERAKENQ